MTIGLCRRSAFRYHRVPTERPAHPDGLEHDISVMHGERMEPI
ncbi:hypothetical protein HMPREF0762_00474 [Slackia exigua ATCC 700122]|uniref:Uncharacterized protein n=1 Tax=Slackia exigua (strain ATCC 700122 / DSM 15923 / CIP 105133 / JCM 11022 / KCTC 5966 / S-7) TaxID=649764 RepID=D0WFF6_SLAES|nr:hypothetical protein HMPREF0762_00474 [Slackia exigua ATCC 700122]